MGTAILKFPQNESRDIIEDLEVVTRFDSASLGSDVKTTEFHLSQTNKVASVTDNQVVLWDVSETEAKAITNMALEGKNSPKFTTGKWYPHQNCNEVMVIIQICKNHYLN